MARRIVLDANIFASALINPTGSPGIAVAHIIKDKDYTLLISESIIDELKRILFYPKVRKRIQFTDEELEFWVISVQIISHIVMPRFKYPVLIAADPEDDHYLITAIEGKADFIISGDKHLLDLKYYQGIKVLTAKEFVNIIPLT